MFLLYEYDIFWAFLIISSAIPVLAFLISGVLSPITKGPEKLSNPSWGIPSTNAKFMANRYGTSSSSYRNSFPHCGSYV